MSKYPYFKQLDKMDCGPTCLKMIAKFYGKNFRLQTLSEFCDISLEGVSLSGIGKAAERVGMEPMAVKLDMDQLTEVELPIILHWRQNHFVVLYKVRRNKYVVADPADSLLTLTKDEVKANWLTKDHHGIALLLNTTPEFYEKENEKSNEVRWSFLIRYLLSYQRLFAQLLLGLAVGTILQLVAPFLTQSVVDIGINTRNINFIYIVLIAQAVLILGRVTPSLFWTTRWTIGEVDKALKVQDNANVKALIKKIWN